MSASCSPLPLPPTERLLSIDSRNKTPLAVTPLAGPHSPRTELRESELRTQKELKQLDLKIGMTMLSFPTFM